MDLNNQDILNIASQDFILGNSTIEEQIDFITDQIKHPFDAGSSNYFKKLKRSVANPDQLDTICLELLGEIENKYPDIEFDLSEYDQHLEDAFNAIYKFFVKNSKKLMYVFLREYLNSNKNRKGLTADYLNTKLPTYPKEQYGKKEYYILITKLPSILKDMKNDGNIWLDKFIEYIERTEDAPMYVSQIKELLDRGIIHDRGVVVNMFEELFDSDAYDSILCKLQVYITKNIVVPYLEENGLSELRIPAVDPEDDDLDDDSDEDDSEEE